MRASSAPPSRETTRERPRPFPFPIPSPPLAIALAVAWVGLQATLILTASQRSDAIFGFRMFSESSTIRAHLTRELADGKEVAVRGGDWIAKDKDGAPHRMRWRDRVIEGNLATFDAVMHASYSAAAQVDRWRGALDDVAAHLDNDAETKRLHLELVVRKNGGDPVTYRFTSAPR